MVTIGVNIADVVSNVYIWLHVSMVYDNTIWTVGTILFNFRYVLY